MVEKVAQAIVATLKKCKRLELLGVGNIQLAADHPQSYERFSPMVSRLLHLMIIDVLDTTVALHIGSAKLHPLLRNMKHNLLNKRYS
jgi:RpiR family carbohydrate utilization transcriptional regulator